MKKLSLILFLTGIVTGICGIFGLFSLVPNLQAPIFSKQELSFANYADTLYIKKRNVGNEATVVISTSYDSEFDPDTSSEFVYDVSSTPFFYKQTSDSLIIYTGRSSGFPSDFKSKVKILQIELSNPEMMNLVSNNHFKEIGISKID
ncbi:MAG: hypothetical protein V4594_25035 [Bacteroidota bacterium]